jgi:gamma-glutamyl-gamma-aminobutyrate hydrolase PuuD
MRLVPLFRQVICVFVVSTPGTMGAVFMTEKVLVVYRDAADVAPYAAAMEAAGAEPLLQEARPGLKIGLCRGLLLTGGSDVDPSLYGETRAPETEPPDAERDAAEGALIDEALARDLPLLAICRGMQILNVERTSGRQPGSAPAIRRSPREAHSRQESARTPGGD